MPDPQSSDPLLTASAPAGDAPPFGPPTHPGDLGQLGRFRVMKRLGQGGMGAVYLGYDENLRRRVALKVMLPRFAAAATAKERFLREARAAAALRSDHVVTIFDVGEAGGVPYIAMEYLQGTPLDRYLKESPAPTLDQVIRIGRDTARGLAAAHALGLVHRDIKPGNLWLEAPDGRVKVLDFGLARHEDDLTHYTAADSDTPESVGGTEHLTKTGAVMGTPAYMAPEQARGHKVDFRADLFSLGGVLYRLLTGRLPFAGANQMELLTRLAMDDPTPVRELNPAVPPGLAGLVHRLLAKDPAARPASAAEVVAALDALAGPAGGSGPQVVYVPLAVEAQPESVWEQIDDPTSADAPPRAKAARPTWPIALAGLAGALVLVAAVWIGLKKGGSKPTGDAKPPAVVAAKPVDPKPAGTDPGEEDEVNWPPPEPPGPADTPFFTGHDLTGWLPPEGGTTWEKANGELTGRWQNAARRAANSRLASRRTFRDFVLTFRIKGHVRGKRPAEASPTGYGYDAVLVRAGGRPRPAGGRPWIGVVCRFGPDKCGTVRVGETESAAAAQPPYRADGFNDVAIQCAGSRLTITVNGTVVTDDLDIPDMPAEGRIAWQLGTIPDGMTVKDVRLLDLEKPVADPSFLDGLDFARARDEAAKSKLADPSGVRRVGGGVVITAPGMATEVPYRVVTKGSYRDFVLKFRMQVKQAKSTGSGGVIFRYPLAPGGVEPVRGRWQLFNGTEERLNVFALPPEGEAFDRTNLKRRPADRWKPDGVNDVTIRVLGSRIRTVINGGPPWEEVIADLPAEGAIGFFARGAVSQATFEDIKFLDLRPQFGPPPADPAFFNGKDLAGWTGDTAAFTVEGGELVCQKQDKTAVVQLRSPAPVGDFELTFAAKAVCDATVKDTGAWLLFREAGKGKYSTLEFAHNRPGLTSRGDTRPWSELAPWDQFPRPLRSAADRGQWAAYRVRVQGRRVTVAVNDQPVSDGVFLSVEPTGSLVWHVAKGCTELRVKDVRLTRLEPAAPLTAADLVPWLRPETGRWKVETGALIATAAKDSYMGLNFKQRARDFDLAFVGRMKPGDPTDPKAVASVRFRVTDPVEAGVAVWPAPGNVYRIVREAGRSNYVEMPHDRVPGKNKGLVPADTDVGVTVRVRGKWVTATVNGHVVVDQEFAELPDGDRVIFLVRGGELTVRDVVFRDLAGEVDLLPLIDPARDAVAGAWQKTPAGLVGGDGVAQIDIPYKPGTEYDLVAEIERSPAARETRGVEFNLVRAGRPFKWFAAFYRTEYGFSMNVQEKKGEVEGPAVVSGKKFVTRIEVRTTGVTAYHDGVKMAESATPREGRPNAGENLTRQPGVLGLLTFGGPFTVSRLEVREVGK